MFIENTTSFFTMLGEIKKDKKAKKSSSVWWSFYVPFFYDLAKSDHMEAYCTYINQSTNEYYDLWLSENKDKLDAFSEWVSPEED